MRFGHLLLVYALFNAVVYSCLQPLWEGFDEPFHYAYVQHLATGRGLPDARSALISREVASSLELAPASHVVKQNLPFVTTYTEFFAMPAEQRDRMKRALWAIDPRLRSVEAGNAPNYEAQHAPLGYAVLAIPEWLLSSSPLPARVLAGRLTAAVLGALLLYFAVSALCVELGLGPAHMEAVLFCVLSHQMTWATIAHVANDWLALPLALWVLVYAIRRQWPEALIALSAGLLTKAYLLALVPVAVVSARRRNPPASHPVIKYAAGIAVLLALAWYLRNWLLYGTWTGMQEARAGVRLANLLELAPTVNWPDVLLRGARAAVWTGNNTFTAFSAGAVYLLLGVVAAGLVLWAFSRKSAADGLVATYLALVFAALAYSTLVARAFSRLPDAMASPWYSQLAVAPLFALSVAGAARRSCRIIPIALTAASAYIISATYVVKLIPMYSGFETRATPAGLFRWYVSGAGDLGALTPVPAPAVLSGVVVVCVLALALSFEVVRRIRRT